MSKKVFALVSGIVGALQAASVALATYYTPENATVINSAIVIVGTAIIEACTLFVKNRCKHYKENAAEPIFKATVTFLCVRLIRLPFLQRNALKTPYLQGMAISSTTLCIK